MRIEERRAKLLGYDSAQKVEVAGRDGAPLSSLLILPATMTPEEWDQAVADSRQGALAGPHPQQGGAG
jgi:hypothetical protein